ncbi:MAG: hypothetical protein KKD44_29185, partial [Proteobacteria bacterium]|nr:hypothetical protein [Pseudomonadota bacterium]
MAYLHFDSKYAPSGFLIVPDGGDPYGREAALVQSDWDFPAVASAMGWTPCEKCDLTDGTVDCAHRTATEMISEAYDFCRDHEGETFRALDEHLSLAHNPSRPPESRREAVKKGRKYRKNPLLLSLNPR